ncbi:MAG TPA: hypothetical protein VMF65_12865, partial [Acidimicrobiales bacterium]|nr:hypothetical protein [Acidimicrobiales bacterium]
MATGGYAFRRAARTANLATSLAISGGTKRQAQCALAKLVTEVEQQLITFAGTGKLGELLERWLDYIRPNRAAYTIDEYRRLINKTIKPALGNVRLDRLSAPQLDAFYPSLQEKGLSGSTIHQHHSILHASLRRAVRWGLIAANPADRATAPCPARSTATAPEVAEVQKLIAEAEADGDRWLLRATNADGSMAVRRLDGPGEVVLPAAYVREHVELAYATTAYRAQGRTVATAHALAPPTTSREVLYVSATRGREDNRLYVDTYFDPDPPTSHPGLARPQSTRAVLAAVLAREGSEPSAHEAVRHARQEVGSFAVLAVEYWTIARHSQQQRFDALLGRCGLGPEQLNCAHSSGAYGPLLAALRDAQGRGLDIESALPRLAAARTLEGADDPIAVLHDRVERWAVAAGSKRRASAGFIAGVVPRALGVDDEDLARALQERTGPWSAGPRSWPNRRWPRGKPGRRASGRHRSRRAGGKPGCGPPWRPSGTAGSSAPTRAPWAPKVLLPPWRGWPTVAVPNRP